MSYILPRDSEYFKIYAWQTSGVSLNIGTGVGFDGCQVTIQETGGSGTSGNLVIATDSTGTYNDIVFATGGFNSSNEVARFHGNVSAGNFTIKNTTASTSATMLSAVRDFISGSLSWERPYGLYAQTRRCGINVASWVNGRFKHAVEAVLSGLVVTRRGLAVPPGGGVVGGNVGVALVAVIERIETKLHEEAHGHGVRGASVNNGHIARLLKHSQQ